MLFLWEFAATSSIRLRQWNVHSSLLALLWPSPSRHLAQLASEIASRWASDMPAAALWSTPHGSSWDEPCISHRQLRMLTTNMAIGCKPRWLARAETPPTSTDHESLSTAQHSTPYILRCCLNHLLLCRCVQSPSLYLRYSNSLPYFGGHSCHRMPSLIISATFPTQPPAHEFMLTSPVLPNWAAFTVSRNHPPDRPPSSTHRKTERERGGSHRRNQERPSRSEDPGHLIL